MMPTLQITTKILALCLCALLTACGGGNSDMPQLDTTPPVIILNGESEILLFLGESYEELGANAVDNKDGVVDVIITGSVDTSALELYTITYTATDSAGNTSSAVLYITVVEQRPFITTWITNGVEGSIFNGSSSNDNQIMIGTRGAGYDYTVDWGDGSIDEHITENIIHTYATAGTYTVTINGSFPQIYFAPPSNYYSYNSDHNKLISIEQWGDIKWNSMNHAFANCRHLIGNATDTPNLSKVTDMSYMFSLASWFNQDLSNWDVSNVTDMSYMFTSAHSFNQYLSNWDVSNVTNMAGMFDNANDFNQDLSNWDVSNVTNMERMFRHAFAFNQDLSTWNVQNVANMKAMFNVADSFNQFLNSWDVSNVTDMSNMFDNAHSFNQDLSNWDVSNVTDMSYMFDDASNFNQNLSNWDVSNVINMHDMFTGAYDFNGDINGWDVSHVTDMSYMFESAYTFNQDLSNWDVSNVLNMSTMFSNTKAFNQDLSSWNVSNVTNMHAMFQGTDTFNQDLSNWDVSNVTNIAFMFSRTDAFNQDLDHWDVSNVTDMSHIFRFAASFNQNLSNWNITNVKWMDGVFNNVTLSTLNYDALLLSWSNLPLQINLNFDGGNSQFSSSSQSARDVLTDIYGWTVTDGGIND